jgi:hypothetical protein
MTAKLSSSFDQGVQSAATQRVKERSDAKFSPLSATKHAQFLNEKNI